MFNVIRIRQVNFSYHLFQENIIRTLSQNASDREVISPINVRERYRPAIKDKKKDTQRRHDANVHYLKRNVTLIDKFPFRNNPDEFGTLGSESLLEKRLEELPEEEDDKQVEEYLDNAEGKTRLKKIQYAKLIKTLIAQRKLTEALDVLEIRMKKENAYPDDYIYRLLISGCAKVGYTKKAFQLFNQMKKRALIVKLGVYTSLFDACANSPWPNDGLKRASGLWDLMIEKRIELNQQIAHAAIKAFGRSGAIDRAFSIVDEMSSRKVLITSETFNFLLQACITDKVAGFRHALVVWRKMIDKEIVPTTYTFNLLLRCTRDCSIGDMDLFRKDLTLLLPPPQQKWLTSVLPSDNESITCTHSKLTPVTEVKTGQFDHRDDENQLNNIPAHVPSLISQHPHLGSVIHLGKIWKSWHRLMLLGGSQGFLDTMLKTTAKPDIKTFTQLLFTIAPSSEEEEALMTEMKRHGVKMDIDFCNMLIKKRNMHNNYNGAFQVLNIIRDEHLVPNIVTFGVLAMGCTDLKNIQTLLKDVKAVGLRLNIQILGALLNSSCRTWNFKAIEFIVKQLIKNEIKPDNLFNHILENCNKEIKRQIKMKKNGNEYNSKLMSNQFEKEYIDFEQLVIYVKSMEVEDPANVHPWDQFKKLDKLESRQ